MKMCNCRCQSLVRAGSNPRQSTSPPNRSISSSQAAARSSRAVGIVGGIEFFEKLVSQQLHAHRGYFAKLDRRASVSMQVLLACGQGVKGVTGPVQDRLDIALNANCIH